MTGHSAVSPTFSLYFKNEKQITVSSGSTASLPGVQQITDFISCILLFSWVDSGKRMEPALLLRLVGSRGPERGLSPLSCPSPTCPGISDTFAATSDTHVRSGSPS